MRPFCPLLVCLAALAVAGPRTAGAKSASSDAPPVLLSTEGGGPRWKNDAELKKFAEAGDPAACFEFGNQLYFGDDHRAGDPARALPWFKQAAAGGVADADFRLGKIYHDGVGGKRNYALALHHYEKAAIQGVPEAQHNIGAMLVSGRGVKRNYVEGLAWLIVAGKSGAASMAEVQVRDRLARRPADIKAAEERAAEILNDLPAARVQGQPTPAVVTNKIIAPPAAPKAAPLIKAPLLSPVPLPAPAVINPLAPATFAPPRIELPPLPQPAPAPEPTDAKSGT